MGDIGGFSGLPEKNTFDSKISNPITPKAPDSKKQQPYPAGKKKLHALDERSREKSRKGLNRSEGPLRSVYYSVGGEFI